MIEYIRSYIDEISLQALHVNVLIWIVFWVILNLFKFFNKKKAVTIFNSKYINDFSLIFCFIISFLIIRYYIKLNFINKYLNI
jgi:hypothetical protein